MDAGSASVQLVRATQRLRTTYATALRKSGSEEEVAEWIDREVVGEHWDKLNCPLRARGVGGRPRRAASTLAAVIRPPGACRDCDSVGTGAVEYHLSR